MPVRGTARLRARLMLAGLVTLGGCTSGVDTTAVAPAGGDTRAAGGTDAPSATPRPSTLPDGEAAPAALEWATLVVDLAGPLDRDAPNACVRGTVPGCADAVIAEMATRLTALDRACDHNAVFAATALAQTEAIRDAAVGGTFEDPAALTHLQAVFARLYFAARDAWLGGDRADVPAAWRAAFTASDARAVNGLGDALLAINAHISRDLPFALAEALGPLLADDDVVADFARVNELIAQTQDEVLDTLRTTYDPSVTTLAPPFALGAATFPELLALWRAEAYDAAVRLTEAPSDRARDAVAAEIEVTAVARADLIRVATSYLPVVGDVTGRDARCSS